MNDEYPKKIVLKDSSECEFRFAQGNEKEDLIDFFRRVDADDLWAMKRDYSQEDSIELLLLSIMLPENEHLLAYQNNKIIGIASIYYSRYGARKNIGEVELIIDASFKQKRLGTWLMLELIDIASSLHIEIIQIELMAGKDDAVIIAAKRLNFLPAAVLKNYLKDKSGKFVDMVVLIKEIIEEWSDY